MKTATMMLLVADGIVVGAMAIGTLNGEVVAVGFYEASDAQQRLASVEMRRNSIDVEGVEMAA